LMPNRTRASHGVVQRVRVFEINFESMVMEKTGNLVFTSLQLDAAISQSGRMPIIVIVKLQEVPDFGRAKMVVSERV
jgi:hypothetical protein